MKKLLLVLACAVAAVFVNAAPQKITIDKLPQNSQEFIQKNFPKEKVKDVEMDREASWDKYTVYFTSGNQVSFEGGSGDWSEINMKVGAVPATIVPIAIKSHVGNNYPQYQIMLLAKTKDGYKVKLSNGTELYYDKDGNIAKTVE